MRYIFHLFLVCIFVHSPVKAVISIDDLIAKAPERKEEEILQPPNPTDLSPTWWDYYVASGEELEHRIEASETYFSSLESIAPEESKEEIEEYIQKILMNLKALPKLRAQNVSSYTPSPFLDKYTLDQLLDSVARKKQLDDSLDEEIKELKQNVERAKKVKQHIDTMFAAYLDMKTQNVQKEISGLEIFSLKMALAIVEENIRLTKDRITQFSAENDHLKEEIVYARAHLDVGKINLEGLNQEIDASKQRLKAAQEAALNSEMNALGVLGDTPLDRSISFLNQQKSVLDSIKVAFFETTVIFNEAKRTLALLLANQYTESYESISEQMSSWLEELQSINGQVDDWTSKTEQENDRSLQPIAMAEGASPALQKQQENTQQQRAKVVQETTQALNQLKLKLNFNEMLLENINNRVLAKEGTASSWFYSLAGLVEDCCSPVLSWLYTPIVKIGGVPLTAISLFRVLLIIAATYAISRFLRFLLHRADRAKMHLTQSSTFILDRIIHYAALLIGFTLALASIGLNLSNLAIILGALSVGIGFGLQNIVNNFLSGLILMFSRTLKVGDIVEVKEGSYGKVVAINIQNTVIHTSDGIDVIIPNSQILSGKMVNYTLDDNFRRVHIPFTASYKIDKEIVAKAAKEAAEKVPCTVKNSSYMKDPELWLVGFGENSVQYELVVWINAYGYGHRGSMKASYLWELDNMLKKYEITYPNDGVLKLEIAKPMPEQVAFESN